MTLDYRALNNVTYKDSYQLQNIADCLDAFKGSSWFGILDLRMSFYEVPLADRFIKFRKQIAIRQHL